MPSLEEPHRREREMKRKGERDRERAAEKEPGGP